MMDSRKPGRSSRRWPVLLLTVLLLMSLVLGAPTPVDTLASGVPQSPAVPVANATTARGGAVTQLDISLYTQTLVWQGYWGRMVGTIVLEDDTGDQLFNWSNVVSGEVFASRSATVDFSSIQCANASVVLSEETITGTGSDSVSSTFTSLSSQEFTVGRTTFLSGACDYSSYLYNSSATKGTYEEVLLHDTQDMVYMSILAENGQAFNSKSADFEIIVPEDGSDDVGTDYYFYAELD